MKPPSLNFEEAAWELFYTVVSPRKMYKSQYFRQQTRNKWAREDPSFVLLLCALLSFSALIWGLTFSPTYGGVFRLIFYMLIVDFLLVGVAMSTATYFLVNKYGRKADPHSGTPLEWAYCFDVHCNAFVLIYLWLYVVQYLLLPLVSRRNFFSIFLGNTLYFVAVSHYFVITFLGYSMLPFLKNTQLFLAPIGVAFVVYTGCTVTKTSLVRYMSKEYLEWDLVPYQTYQTYQTY